MWATCETQNVLLSRTDISALLQFRGGGKWLSCLHSSEFSRQMLRKPIPCVLTWTLEQGQGFKVAQIALPIRVFDLVCFLDICCVNCFAMHCMKSDAFLPQLFPIFIHIATLYTLILVLLDLLITWLLLWSCDWRPLQHCLSDSTSASHMYASGEITIRVISFIMIINSLQSVRVITYMGFLRCILMLDFGNEDTFITQVLLLSSDAIAHVRFQAFP